MSEGHEAAGGRRWSGGTIALLVGAIVLVVFIVQNTKEVRLDFLMFNFTWPLWLYTFVVAAFGGLLWFGIEVVRRRSRD